ncbi:MAG: SAM-dependent methyltransferase [Burkholderiales bacterium]
MSVALGGRDNPRLRVTPITRNLPEADLASLQHSARVAAFITEVIRTEDGWIPFSKYMDLAMFAPGLGYYSAGAAKIGAAGDFTTAPEMSCLFGATLAKQVAQVLHATGGDVLEFGAGSGKLARDLLGALGHLGCEPRHYLILEPSPDLRERQLSLLHKEIPEFRSHITWIDGMPENFTGVIIANEVLDAMPIDLVAWKADGIYQRGVAVSGESFIWQDRMLGPGPLLDHARSIDVVPGYVSEIHLAGTAFVRSLGYSLKRGVALLIDYGFLEHEYYHPDRNTGTLMCHYRHRGHTNPFFLPGAQDITAHVDFSTMIDAARGVGLDIEGFTTQAKFLIACGITDQLNKTDPANAAQYLPLANQTQRLLSPAEMGELFKVLAVGRGIDSLLLGFARP